MSKSSRSQAAVKANETRRFFRNVRDTYGQTTEQIVRILHKNPDVTAHTLAERTGVSVPTAAAYKANWTRGTYNRTA